jgi:hypothetical protein
MSGMPVFTIFLMKVQQHEQQLHISFGFSFPSKVYVMWTKPASWERLSASKAFSNETFEADPFLIRSLAVLSKKKQTSSGALHFFALVLQAQSPIAMVSASSRIFFISVRSRIVCFPSMRILTGIVLPRVLVMPFSHDKPIKLTFKNTYRSKPRFL